MNDEQTPALRQAVENMATMREAYDNLSQAAEAYNTGKVQLAQNITSKGVEASATETLPKLADKVAAISQETYEINGGEMYAKQLFGSLDTPNYWNLYDVLAQLLSDGRLVSYGGILLAEYYRGYDSLALAGAGAGGAYVVSDKDENGQFKMYTEDTTHTWATEFDGKGNRWVAYCFADEYHDFQITDTNTSPRSIFIGRKVGTITSLVNGRVSQIVVPDGNELRSFSTGNFNQQFNKKVIIRNIGGQNGTLIRETGIVESVYIDMSVAENAYCNNLVVAQNLNSLIIDFNNTDFRTSNNTPLLSSSIKPSFLYYKNIKLANGYLVDTRGAYFAHIECETSTQSGLDKCICGPITHLEFNIETLTPSNNYFAYLVTNDFNLGYITNDPTKSVRFTAHQCNVGRMILMNGWRKNLDFSVFNSFSAECIALDILDKLGVCDEQNRLTLQIGATNLATIQNSEEYSSYLTDAIDNKNWNVIA